MVEASTPSVARVSLSNCKQMPKDKLTFLLGILINMNKLSVCQIIGRQLSSYLWCAYYSGEPS